MQRSFSESPANTELYKAVTEICIAPEVLDELWIIVLWICLKCIPLTSDKKFDTDNNRIQLRQDHRMRETCFEAATLPYFIFCHNSTARTQEYFTALRRKQKKVVIWLPWRAILELFAQLCFDSRQFMNAAVFFVDFSDLKMSVCISSPLSSSLWLECHAF